MKLHVYSEIEKLKAVLLHRPGKELENLTPELLEELLFDDIPFLKEAQKEHDEFAGLLRAKGVKVYYITELVKEVIESNEEARKEFLEKWVQEAVGTNTHVINKELAANKLMELLESYDDDREMVKKTVEGVRTSEIEGGEHLVKSNYLFVAMPMPNLYFQRDPFGTIAGGVSINKMYSVTRNRETLYSHIIFKYHELFKDEEVPRWYDRNLENHIEGGDILVLNEKTLAVGISQRTQFEAIEKLAYNIFYSQNTTFENILAFNIGESRAFMHLDTVFTQVDYDKFSVHPEIITSTMEVFEITKDSDEINIKRTEMKLEKLLEKYTGQEKVTLIPCGGDDPIASAREQWNDGANTLAIAPGEVIVYSRNPVTNKLLEENGIKVNVISSAELSRGRGGPRCMSMPLVRGKIK